MHSTIIAGNTDTGGISPDVAGELNSQGFNLIQDISGATIIGDLAGNIIGQDPLLGPLADNGGPTLTHALLTGSPAIDTADTSDFPDTDQRGVERPQGARPDIGAFEFEVQVVTEPIVVQPNGVGAIVDNLDAEDQTGINITAAAASLRAATGVGAGVNTATATDDGDIDTQTGTLASLNTAAGDINVDNFGGELLTIGVVGSTGGVVNNAPGGDISVINHSPLTVALPGVTNNNGGNINLTAAAPGDLIISGPVTVQGNVGNVVLTGGTNVVVNNSVAGTDVSTQGIDSFVQITAQQNNVNINSNASVQTTGNGSSIMADAADNFVLGTNAELNSVDLVDVDAVNNVTLGDGSLVQTTGTGNTVNITAAGGDVNLADATQILSQTDINIIANQNVNFDPNVNIQTFGAGGVIDIDAENGDVLGDFRGLGSSVTIQTPDGIAIRGEPFVDVQSIDIPVIDIFGDTSLTVTFGVAGETGLTWTIDWGDGTVDVLIVNAGTNSATHNYTGNPSSNQADPISITFLVEHADSIQVDAFVTSVNIDYTITETTSQADVTGDGFGGVAIDTGGGGTELTFPEDVEIPFLANMVTLSLDNQTERIIKTTIETRQTTSRRVIIHPLTPTGERVTVVDENGDPRLDENGKPRVNDFVEIDLDESVLDDLKKLFKELPDGRYRIYLREAGEERLRLLFDINLRAGIPSKVKKVESDSDDSQNGNNEQGTDQDKKPGENNDQQQQQNDGGQPPGSADDGNVDGNNTNGQAETSTFNPQQSFFSDEFGEREELAQKWEHWDRSLIPPVTLNETSHVSGRFTHSLMAGAILAGGGLASISKSKRRQQKIDTVMETLDDNTFSRAQRLCRRLRNM